MSKFGFKKKLDYKLSEEVAVELVNEMLEYYEIDIENLPEKEASSIEMVLDNLVKAIRLGRLEITFDDGISCVQHLKNGKDSITYKEINGQAKTAMGTKSEKDGNGRIYAVMGALSEGEAMIRKLKGPDISLVESLGTVFLLV